MLISQLKKACDIFSFSFFSKAVLLFLLMVEVSFALTCSVNLNSNGFPENCSCKEITGDPFSVYIASRGVCALRDGSSYNVSERSRQGSMINRGTAQTGQMDPNILYCARSLNNEYGHPPVCSCKNDLSYNAVTGECTSETGQMDPNILYCARIPNNEYGHPPECSCKNDLNYNAVTGECTSADDAEVVLNEDVVACTKLPNNEYGHPPQCICKDNLFYNQVNGECESSNDFSNRITNNDNCREGGGTMSPDGKYITCPDGTQYQREDRLLDQNRRIINRIFSAPVDGNSGRENNVFTNDR